MPDPQDDPDKNTPDLPIPDLRLWPDALRALPCRRLADGRRVVAGRELAALLRCTPANLRKMAAAGTLRRERDLDESTRSWYRLEEAVRAYIAKYPCCLADPEDEVVAARLWPEGRLLKPTAPSLPTLPQQAAPETPADRQPDAVPANALDKDALIARLAADLADKDEELKRLRAALAEQPPRRGHLQRRQGRG